MVDITYLSGYTKRKSITIDYTKVSTTLSNFPVLVKITDDANIGASSLPTGYDIRFTTSDGTTLLNYERESFSIVDNVCNAIIWVNVPSVSNTENTVLYIYYGKSDATDGENKNAVWDSNYKGVWHLNAISPNVLDSTINANHGTVSGDVAPVAGSIGNGLTFDGTGDYINVGMMPEASSDLSYVTVSACIQSSNSAKQALMGTLNISDSEAYFIIMLNSNYNGSNLLGYIQFYLRSNSGDNFTGSVNSNTGITDGNKHHFVITLDKTTASVSILIDGVPKTVSNLATSTGTDWCTWTRPLVIGGNNKSSVTEPYSGILDEIRFSTGILRSVEWSQTEYANQFYPSTFYLLSQEQTNGQPPSNDLNPTLIYFDEDNEMKQFVGTTRKHPVAAYSDSTGAPVNLLISPTFYVSVNGENRQQLELTISEFDAHHQWFWLTIPGTLGTITPVDGDEVSITFGDGTASGFAMIQFEDERPNVTELSNVGSNVVAIKAITDLLTLAAINAEVDTALSDAAIVSKIDTVNTVVDGIATALETPDNFKADISNLATSAEIAALSNVAAVGAEKIVPADKYVFNASAKTLTFSSPYDTLTVEQVTFIKNLTTNYIIWDCRYAGYQTLPIRFGAAPSTHVLSFDSADLDAANTDKIMIVVNQV